LFCKPVDGRAMSLEVFSVIIHFLGEIVKNWKNCIGLFTDGSHSMSGRNTGLQVMVTKKVLHITWTHCMLYR
jgi:hypothetical protein